jgi:hypothetical protein
MLRSHSDLRRLKIRAKDGDLGSVHDFYFDDELWMVRFYVVDTGTWLIGRKVLISPVATGEADLQEEVIPVDLTMDQVKNSPDVSTERPVSKQAVAGLYAYYGWAFPWEGAVYMPPSLAADPAAVEEPEEPKGDPHLRSAREIDGYRIEATDGTIGHVEDLLINDEDVRIRYLVVDTRNFLPGRHVVISPDWVRELNYPSQKVIVDLTKKEIETSPEYSATAQLDRDQEARIFSHYRRKPYWLI